MRPRLRAARRAVALALLSALLGAFAAPLVAAGDDEGPFCGRGRCCCAPDAGDERTCLRSTCGCGRPGASPALASLAEGVLSPSAAEPGLEAVGTAPRLQPLLPKAPDRAPADHPPPAA